MSSTDPRCAPGARNALNCLVVSAVLAACAVGPDFHSPPPPVTEHYTQGAQPQSTEEVAGPAGAAHTIGGDRDIPADWWSLFQSEPLDALVKEALHDSPTVESARAALRSAQESYIAERGALLLAAVVGCFCVVFLLLFCASFVVSFFF